ncbi:MAG TPA: hypothetical protein PL002_04820 [Flavobacteriales bacterium]|nr:hypothetical protein [Flavobacteriales bacterium]HNA32245.1 hypothetical protein [Flavobacteriales bacterium]HNK40485.1 hypothetical protein [Flavobacteriales bacterium]HRT54246.1 hypothetical protein [Flavobacteriales bacterium]
MSIIDIAVLLCPRNIVNVMMGPCINTGDHSIGAVRACGYCS